MGFTVEERAEMARIDAEIEAGTPLTREEVALSDRLDRDAALERMDHAQRAVTAHKRQYYAENRDEIAAQQRQYRAENREKTPTHGKTVWDKSPYSNKQVESFRYNDAAVERLREILGVPSP